MLLQRLAHGVYVNEKNRKTNFSNMVKILRFMDVIEMKIKFSELDIDYLVNMLPGTCINGYFLLLEYFISLIHS